MRKILIKKSKFEQKTTYGQNTKSFFKICILRKNLATTFFGRKHAGYHPIDAAISSSLKRAFSKGPLF